MFDPDEFTDADLLHFAAVRFDRARNTVHNPEAADARFWDLLLAVLDTSAAERYSVEAIMAACLDDVSFDIILLS